MSTIVPPQVAEALRPLLPELAARGVVPVRCEVSPSFGDFAVLFKGASADFTVARDRGQFMVSGPPDEVLRRAGLWRVFVGIRELATPLYTWLEAKSAA